MFIIFYGVNFGVCWTTRESELVLQCSEAGISVFDDQMQKILRSHHTFEILDIDRFETSAIYRKMSVLQQLVSLIRNCTGENKESVYVL
ncbi:hypothetical protein O9G_002201 [Rozella allomycis CSF55]|uniref:Uncharacterized protein n=1 Tax=Rozella allomycis (strain CSF55) TaxID=988480 RepID=A0A075AQ42_ROZAC|nr:hypothetical protein O9G_002201 [Rozella allomycis CSF55]|eukprot:EPZ32361.1 hypothetical protein O9G_002201 [Rozella allomycis CSF55]